MVLRESGKELNINFDATSFEVVSFDKDETGVYKYSLITKIKSPVDRPNYLGGRILLMLLNVFTDLGLEVFYKKDTCLRFFYDGIPVSIDLSKVSKEKIKEVTNKIKEHIV